jgi:predicted 3-demethylubiquinone-9 3-methyltransferase (glyoxalase superfamily)
VTAIHKAPSRYPSGKQGDVLPVEFTVLGLPCLGLNGGPALNHRMHCVGCAIAPFETLEEACDIYGVSLRDLLTELNATTMDSPGPDLLAKSADHQ